MGLNLDIDVVGVVAAKLILISSLRHIYRHREISLLPTYSVTGRKNCPTDPSVAHARPTKPTSIALLQAPL